MSDVFSLKSQYAQPFCSKPTQYSHIKLSQKWSDFKLSCYVLMSSKLISTGPSVNQSQHCVSDPQSKGRQEADNWWAQDDSRMSHLHVICLIFFHRKDKSPGNWWETTRLVAVLFRIQTKQNYKENTASSENNVIAISYRGSGIVGWLANHSFTFHSHWSQFQIINRPTIGHIPLTHKWKIPDPYSSGIESWRAFVQGAEWEV